MALSGIFQQGFLILCFIHWSSSQSPASVPWMVQPKEAPCLLSDFNACGNGGVCNCTFNDRSIDINCTERSLTSLPRNIPVNVTSMSLDSNHLTCIPTDHMVQFSRLKRLVVDRNTLSRSFRLPSSLYLFSAKDNQLEDMGYFFENCSHLNAAYLGNNMIREIPNKVFIGCNRLMTISLDWNRFEVIRNNSFEGLTSLILLRFNSQGNLSEIEPLAFRDPCKKMEILILYKAPLLTSIPTGLFANCKHMSTLTLGNNNINHFQAGVFSGLQDVEELQIAYNDVMGNGMSANMFAGVNSINSLYAFKTNVSSLPEELFSTVHLNGTVDFGGNKIRTLPKKLFSYKNHTLRIIYLYHNLLETLPEGFFSHLSSLQILYLFGNRIKVLPEHMLLGTSVTKIFLFQNNISSISGTPFSTGRNQTNVELAHLQGNNMRHIEPSVLSGISKTGVVILFCDFISIPWTNHSVHILCVGNTFTPVIEFDAYAARSLKRSGFQCSTTEKSSNCSACPVGTYGSGEDNGCLDCPRGGFYQDEVGQSSLISAIACKKCNNGTFVRYGAGESPLSCEVCPDGTNKSRPADFRACFCLDGYFRRDRFGECFLCNNEGLNCSEEYPEIKYGYYWNWSYTDVSNYINFVENLKCLDNSYSNSTSSFTEPLPMVHKCPKQLYCDNQNDSIQGNCASGYSGWLCTSCDDNYYHALGYCHQCPKIWVFLLELLLLLIVVALFAVYVIYRLRRETANLVERSIIDVAVARGKILLAFYQITGEFWNSLDVMNWPVYFRWMTDLMAVLRFDISFIFVKPSCFVKQFSLSPHEEFVIGISFPFVLITTTIVIIGGLQCWCRACKDPDGFINREMKLKRWREKLMTLLLSTLFITYTSTCNVIFALYAPTCEHFFLDEKKEFSVTLLRSDYTIHCDNDTHVKYQRAAYVSIIYVILFPLYLLWQLWKYSRRPDENCSGSEQDWKTSQHPTYPKWLHFLCENYKPTYWYWEIVELGRKASQTVVIILYGYDSPLSRLVSVTISVMFLSLHSAYCPMKDHFEHLLQLASLWAIFLNLMVAALPIPTDNDFVANIIGGVLLLLNVGLLLIIVANGVRQLFLKIKVGSQKHMDRESLVLNTYASEDYGSCESSQVIRRRLGASCHHCSL